MMARRYDRLEEADAMLEAYTRESDPAMRERFMRAALDAIEAVMRSAAESVRRARQVL